MVVIHPFLSSTHIYQAHSMCKEAPHRPQAYAQNTRGHHGRAVREGREEAVEVEKGPEGSIPSLGGEGGAPGG